MRIATYPALAVLAILVGLGIGYLLWGSQVADLTQQVRQQRSELNYRVNELEGRIKAAEDRANQEAAARKVLEDELHRVRPLK
jgi:lipopolysaccharide export system protein LptC